MKSIEEKYQDYLQIFKKHFIYIAPSPNDSGSFIPASEAKFEGGECVKVVIGDGTINMAEYLQYLLSCQLLKQDCSNEILNILLSLERLSKKALFDSYQSFPNYNFRYESGFFLRDDISSEFAFRFETKEIVSGYSGSVEMINEDPCFSPFVSQDQIWNLAPILTFLSFYGATNEIRNKSTTILTNILDYVIQHNHVIYNPYYSYMKHMWTFLPSMNEKKVKPWERIEDRESKLKYDIKVKRGANNWYFAYGFRKTFEEISDKKISKWKNFVYSLIYYPLIFIADRIYYPIMIPLFGIKRKDNSYYCLSVSGNVWYSGRKSFLKRVCKIFNKEKRHWHLAFLESLKQYNINEIDLEALKRYLDEYPELLKVGTVVSPIKFLTLYNYYKFVKELR